MFDAIAITLFVAFVGRVAFLLFKILKLTGKMKARRIAAENADAQRRQQLFYARETRRLLREMMAEDGYAYPPPPEPTIEVVNIERITRKELPSCSDLT